MNPEGDPLEILREQELETSARFLAQVRGKIYRRTATSHVVTYSWNLPKVSILELARVLSDFLQSFGTNKEPKP